LKERAFESPFLLLGFSHLSAVEKATSPKKRRRKESKRFVARKIERQWNAAARFPSLFWIVDTSTDKDKDNDNANDKANNNNSDNDKDQRAELCMLTAVLFPAKIQIVCIQTYLQQLPRKRKNARLATLEKEYEQVMSIST
jgi:hypothetical protein